MNNDTMEYLMSHQLASRRVRIPAAAGAALLLTLAAVAPAWPATGKVDLSVTIRTDDFASRSASTAVAYVSVPNPADNACYTVKGLVTLQPNQTASFHQVSNSTNERLILYPGDDCTGNPVGDMLSPGQARTVNFKSFRAYYTGAGNILP